MIKLCGFAISNYYNKVKLALLEKGIPYVEELVSPAQDEVVLRRSPLGKVPFIETERGPLSESQVIVEYLEDAYPEARLLPTDPYEKAKCRELIAHLELNIEVTARQLYGEAFFGSPVPAALKDQVRVKLHNGAQALSRLAKFAPYASGGLFTAADCAAWCDLWLIDAATQRVLGESFIAQLPGATAYMAMMETRPHVQKVAADRDQAIEQMLAKRAS